MIEFILYGIGLVTFSAIMIYLVDTIYMVVWGKSKLGR